MKKNVIIDGDKFQKEYKKEFHKEVITNLIQGILLLLISCSGLFFGSNLLLKLFIYIFPLFIFIYAINLFSMGISSTKTSPSRATSFFIESLLFALLAIYILLNPIDTLSIILIIIGGVIIVNAITKMIYFPNYVPIGSLICGSLLILFSDALINLFYSVVMVFLLIYSISKISKAIYDIRNN